MNEPNPGRPVQEKRGWSVRAITRKELPAVCAYCRVRRPDQAVAVIAFRIIEVYDSGVEIVRSERSAPVCVDHGVYVQQKYILPGKVSA